MGQFTLFCKTGNAVVGKVDIVGLGDFALGIQEMIFRGGLEYEIPVYVGVEDGSVNIWRGTSCVKQSSKASLIGGLRSAERRLMASYEIAQEAR